MRIDELRRTLHEHGDVVGEESPVTRLQEVHGRIGAARRRRAAAAVAGVAAAMAAVALVVVPGLGERPDPGPAQSPPGREFLDGGYAKDGVVYRDVVLGERLLGAAIGDPGQVELSFDVTLGRTGLRFSPTCYGVGVDHMVHVTLDGHQVTGSSCQERRDPDPGAQGTTTAGDPLEPLRDWGVEPGDTVEVVVRLAPSRRGESLDAGATSDAVIGAGIYEDLSEEKWVAGVPMPELIEHDGRTWVLTGTYTSRPGSRRLWIGAEGGEHAARHLFVAATSGFQGETVYEIRRDGRVIDGASQAAGAEGPSWQTVDVFRPGVPYELELVVRKGLTERTRLALVSYELVG